MYKDQHHAQKNELSAKKCNLEIHSTNSDYYDRKSYSKNKMLLQEVSKNLL